MRCIVPSCIQSDIELRGTLHGEKRRGYFRRLDCRQKIIEEVHVQLDFSSRCPVTRQTRPVQTEVAKEKVEEPLVYRIWRIRYFH